RQDALTGVPNRRRFDEVVQAQWAQHRQTGESLAVLLIDVDHFKAYNDRHGHPAGDQCLRLVAQALQAALLRATAGSEATLARWGGEE
ncbi:GGDEF domain-containing protein, partial [Acinetobacter baumannii]